MGMAPLFFFFFSSRKNKIPRLLRPPPPPPFFNPFVWGVLGGTVFKVERLDPLSWLGVIAFTSLVLIFAEIVRRIRLAM